jgi:hypothetical protein
MEIYNERVFDLLDLTAAATPATPGRPSGGLKVSAIEDGKRGNCPFSNLKI